jgi:2-polyprenyl-3-methyl-5-hydroxy-6-metoxy-1,4-benzoquinol methylase
MSTDLYYDYQAKARGLLTNADVDRLLETLTPVYNRLIKPWLPKQMDAKILEVACGPGIMLRYLKFSGYSNIFGTDSSSCQIKLAGEACPNVKQSDSIEDLKNQGPDQWDCIIAIDFIEHLPKDIFIKFLRLAFSSLKPGGTLILRCPNGDSPFVGRNLFNDITHHWAYTTVATNALLQMNGFESVEFSDDAQASIEKFRWLKIPIMKLTQAVLKRLIQTATRERIFYLSSSVYVRALKPK